MKAVTFSKYGSPDVLEVCEVDRPVPKKGEVLIKVHSTTVTQADIKMRAGKPFAARLYNGLFKPQKVKILGFDLSGTIKELNDESDEYKVDDDIFALAGFHFGAYAEYICLPINGSVTKGLVCKKPENLSFDEAAAIPSGALTAFSFLKKMDIKKEQSILIYGASGSIGVYAVQIARYLGARVTGVCSTDNIGLISSIGACDTIDYIKQDLSKTKERYDIVFDTVRKLDSKIAKRLLKPKGRYFHSSMSVKVGPEYMLDIKELIENGYMISVIDRTYMMDDIVEAHRYVDKGHKKGNVVISVDQT